MLFKINQIRKGGIDCISLGLVKKMKNTKIKGGNLKFIPEILIRIMSWCKISVLT